MLAECKCHLSQFGGKKGEFFWARFSQEIFSHIKLFLRISTKNKAEKRNFSFDEMVLKSWMFLFTQLLVFAIDKGSLVQFLEIASLGLHWKVVEENCARLSKTLLFWNKRLVHEQTLANRTKPWQSLQVEKWLCFCYLLMFLLSKIA
jgi:hypothetical protein